MADNAFYPGWDPNNEKTQDQGNLFPGYFPGKPIPRPIPKKDFVKGVDYQFDEMFAAIDAAAMSLNVPGWVKARIVDDFKNSLKVTVKAGSARVDETIMDDVDVSKIPGVTIALSFDPEKWAKDPAGMAVNTLKSWAKTVYEGGDMEAKTTELAWRQVVGIDDYKAPTNWWEDYTKSLVDMDGARARNIMGNVAAQGYSSHSRATPGNPLKIYGLDHLDIGGTSVSLDPTDPSLAGLSDDEKKLHTDVTKAYDGAAKSTTGMIKAMPSPVTRYKSKGGQESTYLNAVRAEVKLMDKYDAFASGTQLEQYEGAAKLFLKKMEMLDEMSALEKKVSEVTGELDKRASETWLTESGRRSAGRATTSPTGYSTKSVDELLEELKTSSDSFKAKMASIVGDVDTLAGARAGITVAASGASAALIGEQSRRDFLSSLTDISTYADNLKSTAESLQGGRIDAVNFTKLSRSIKSVQNDAIATPIVQSTGIKGILEQRRKKKMLSRSDIYQTGIVETFREKIYEVDLLGNRSGGARAEDKIGTLVRNSDMAAKRLMMFGKYADVLMNSYKMDEIWTVMSGGPGKVSEYVVWNLIVKKYIGTPADAFSRWLQKNHYFGLKVSDAGFSPAFIGFLERVSKIPGLNNIARNFEHRFIMEIDGLQSTNGVLGALGFKLTGRFLGGKELAGSLDLLKLDEATLRRYFANPSAIKDLAERDKVLQFQAIMNRAFGRKASGIDQGDLAIKTLNSLKKQATFRRIDTRYLGALDKIQALLAQIRAKFFEGKLGRFVFSRVLGWKNLMADFIAEGVTKLINRAIGAASGGLLLALSPILDRVLKPFMTFVARRLVNTASAFGNAVLHGDIEKFIEELGKGMGNALKVIAYVFMMPIAIMLLIGNLGGGFLLTSTSTDSPVVGGGLGSPGGPPIGPGGGYNVCPEETIAPNSCFFKDGFFILHGSYTPDKDNNTANGDGIGHGSNKYWNDVGTIGSGRCTYDLPIAATAPGGSRGPDTATVPFSEDNYCADRQVATDIYGYASDNFPIAGRCGSVYVPQILGVNSWKVGNEFAGGSAGNGVILTSSDQQYKLVLLHLAPGTIRQGATLIPGQKLAELYNQTSNSHVHAELRTVAGTVLKPEEHVCN